MTILQVDTVERCRDAMCLKLFRVEAALTSQTFVVYNCWRRQYASRKCALLHKVTIHEDCWIGLEIILMLTRLINSICKPGTNIPCLAVIELSMVIMIGSIADINIPRTVLKSQVKAIFVRRWNMLKINLHINLI